jgi:hypothetical protein
MRIQIKGIQAAQKANLKLIAAMKPTGAFGRAIRYGTIEAHRYATSITHVDTGALRASHRMAINGLRATIYIDPSSPAPRGTLKPSQYGLIEEARGGTHAFYRRTIREAGGRIARAVRASFLAGLP